MCNENVADGLKVMNGFLIIDQFDAGSTDFVANLSSLVETVAMNSSRASASIIVRAAGAIAFIAATLGSV